MAQDYLVSESHPVNVVPVSFLFATKEPPPLSWHLTKDQLKQIRDSWLEKDNQEAWCEVRTLLNCNADPEILKKAQDGSDE
jgi:hypothetical protein